MARPLRLAFPGSTWHITARGNEKKNIVCDDRDAQRFVDFAGEASARFGWIVYQYVLMTNHYHLVLELTRDTLSKGLAWLNGRYAQMFNGRHERVGHLFQGRFGARLIEKETYLKEVLRYVVLNPVRAGMVSRPEDYRWSSYRATAGLSAPPPWLDVDRTLVAFAPEREAAREFFVSFVRAGIGEESPWNDVVGQIYLGSKDWVDGVRAKIASHPRSDDFPRVQIDPISHTMSEVVRAVGLVFGMTDEEIRFGHGGTARSLAAWLGCHEGQMDLRAIAAGLRMRSTGGVSKMIRSCAEQLKADRQLQSCADRCTSILRIV